LSCSHPLSKSTHTQSFQIWIFVFF
jgi:hypothetical protein